MGLGEAGTLYPNMSFEGALMMRENSSSNAEGPTNCFSTSPQNYDITKHGVETEWRRR